MGGHEDPHRRGLYAVSRVGSATVRSPRWAVQTGLGILKYLNATEELGLEFNAGAIDQRQDGTLEREIEVYTDASFAPAVEYLMVVRSSCGVVAPSCGALRSSHSRL